MNLIKSNYSNIHCFTSVNNAYLPKARILASSVKRYNPDWAFDLILSDKIPDNFNLHEEPFDNIILISELEIENWEAWVFKHNVVELCTAVKGVGVTFILKKFHPEKVIYLDPDITVFNPLDELIALLDISPVILTPHLCTPNQNIPEIMDNEISTMIHGIFNLGFFAVQNKGQGIEFAEWWAHKLLHFCYDDKPNGLFTDQKWCDHAPVFFDQLHILRDSSYNVATWNINKREVKMSKEGKILIDNKPLKFYHFTGYDSGAGHIMVGKYANDKHIIQEMWDWYGRELEVYGQSQYQKYPWAFGSFINGEKISNQMRIAYRLNEDLQLRFPNPFITEIDNNDYLTWFKTNQ